MPRVETRECDGRLTLCFSSLPQQYVNRVADHVYCHKVNELIPIQIPSGNGSLTKLLVGNSCPLVDSDACTGFGQWSGDYTAVLRIGEVGEQERAALKRLIQRAVEAEEC